MDKLRDYAAFGVRWYWIVDPRRRRVEVFERGPTGAYTQVLAAGGRVETVPGCAGLTLDLPALWAELDALAE